MEPYHAEMNALHPAAAAGDRAAIDIIMDGRHAYRLCASLVRNKGLYLPPGMGDRHDLVQEGVLGVYEAISDYDPGNAKEMPFHVFAAMCAHRNIVSAVLTARRVKHQICNTARRLDEPVRFGKNSPDPDGPTWITRHEIGEGRETLCDPLIELLGAEETATGRLLYQELASVDMSDLERTMFGLQIVDKRGYKGAAAAGGGIPEKSADNALQRVMRKLRRRALELATDERFSPETRRVLYQAATAVRRKGGRPAATDWIGDLAKGA